MPEPLKNYKWFFDFLGPDEGHMCGIRTIHYARQTRFQQMEIMDTGCYGRCLVLDGKIQSSTADEFIYHEALVHPALLAHPHPRRVFIVGGGEGATLREVLRHPSVERAVMVDIDQEVVEACRTYLPEMHQGAFDDPRVELRYLDARRYLEETSETFDLIVIDISEPIEEGPAYLLFTREFYEIALQRLTEDGIISLQAGTTALTALLNFAAVHKTLSAVFPVVAPYQAVVPSFGLPWGFAVASKRHDPRALTPGEVDQRIAQRTRGTLRFYDGEAHQGAFLLPKYLRQRLAEEERIIEDNQPLFTYH
ncbi:MAG: polyamine aminopropyltransferase [Nitrospirae bacterium]|nr:polyamine aminopropyltransferase [Nitrospirota bacterium]